MGLLHALGVSISHAYERRFSCTSQTYWRWFVHRCFGTNHSRRSLDEVDVSCITATGVKCPLPLLETGWRSKCVVRNSRIYFVGHETQAFNARETRTCICRRPCYIMQSNVWNVVQVHRTLSFLGTGHTIILSSSLQENVRSLLPVNLQRNNILTARRNQCWRKMTT